MGLCDRCKRKVSKMFYGVKPSIALKNIVTRKNLLKEAAIDGAKKVYQLFNKPFDASATLRYK